MRARYYHKHRHTHRLRPTDPLIERIPHRHYWSGGPDDRHEHWHLEGEEHVHLGESLRLFEYWRRRARWWWHKLVERVGRAGYGGVR